MKHYWFQYNFNLNSHNSYGLCWTPSLLTKNFCQCLWTLNYVFKILKENITFDIKLKISIISHIKFDCFDQQFGLPLKSFKSRTESFSFCCSILNFINKIFIFIQKLLYLCTYIVSQNYFRYIIFSSSNDNLVGNCKKMVL